MAGRKPLPTHLKLVKGTARPHRMNKAEPKPVVAVPAPPDHLDEEASTKFTEMAEMLAHHGVMTELDTGALARYVVIWRRWIEAEQEVMGAIFTFVSIARSFTLRRLFEAVRLRGEGSG